MLGIDKGIPYTISWYTHVKDLHTFFEAFNLINKLFIYKQKLTSLVMKLLPSVSDLSTKEVVQVDVFTIYIFPSETMLRDYLKFRLGCIIIIISLHFFITCLPQLHTTMCAQYSGLMFSLEAAVSFVEGNLHCNLCWFVVTARELDLPSLMPLSIAGWGRLQLGVAY